MSFWEKLKELKALLYKYKAELVDSSNADAYNQLSNAIDNVEEPTGLNPSDKTAISASVGAGGENKVADVKVVQTLLNKQGAKLTVDGAIGANTIAAIKTFQSSIGFSKPDGRIDVGGNTWKALVKNSKVNSSTESTTVSAETVAEDTISASVGAGGENKVADVKVVQTLLNRQGAKLTVDGAIGANTIAAIKTFQSSIGFSKPDGRIDVGGNTWKALSKSTSNQQIEKTDSTDDTVESDSNSAGNINSGEAPGFDASTAVEPALAPTSKITASVGAGGKNNESDVLRVKQLLNKFGYKLEENGTADIALTNAIKDFQQKYRGSSNPDGRIDAGGRTWGTLLGIGRIQGNLVAMAGEYSVEPAVILAIQQIESGGNGFYSDGRPKILFEGHVFWRQLKKAGKNPEDYLPENEDIIYPSYDRSKYEGGLKEYDRLERAKKIDKIAALMSASWGEFQIMGFNHATVGYSDVETFVNAMHIPNGSSLKAVMEFLKNKKLLKHVQGADKDWAALAKGYNGSLYWKNKYDEKLAAAYLRFSKL